MEYVFIFQRAMHTIKGDNSKCIFFRIMPLFRLDFLSSIKHPIAKLWHLHAMLLLVFSFSILEKLVEKMMSHIAYITVGHSWGTGITIYPGIVLTCSHVLRGSQRSRGLKILHLHKYIHRVLFSLFSQHIKQISTFNNPEEKAFSKSFLCK